MLFGSVASLYYVISAADMLMDLFVRDPISLEQYGASEGHWAVIAECADEVGSEMALQLADKGFNIILLSSDTATIESLKVAIVNSISVCHQAPTFFDEEEKSDCDNIVNANITSLMSMIRTVVPQMQERQNGLIINMDSFTSMRSMPFMSVYAGTKGFVKSFTMSLAPELESDGIMVRHGIYSSMDSKL
ncbi:hypothetical protein IW139_001489 [Coemansia sp. RSA 353]|nr:hypothetical protein IW139_001489 [Coemansia sp. RSA 353]